MPITHHKGGTTFTGDSINFFRLCAIKSTVYLELQGIKANRGPVQWRQAKAFYGLKGKTKDAVYQELCALVASERAKQMHVDETGDRPVATVAGERVQ